MTQVLVNVPDDQLEFFTQLIARLQFEAIQPQEEELPDEVKVMLDEAYQEHIADPKSAKTWEEVKQQLFAKHAQ